MTRFPTNFWMRRHCIGLLCMGLAFASCEDLPKPTTTGKQTFGCRVNGKLWRPKGRAYPAGPRNPVYVYNSSTQKESIYIEAFLGTESTILYLDVPVLRKGSYVLNQPAFFPTRRGISYAEFASVQTRVDSGQINYLTDRYLTDSLRTGEIFLARVDRGAGVVSGSFSFTGYDKNTGKTVEVTDGRFDLNYTPR